MKAIDIVIGALLLVVVAETTYIVESRWRRIEKAAPEGKARPSENAFSTSLDQVTISLRDRRGLITSTGIVVDRRHTPRTPGCKDPGPGYASPFDTHPCFNNTPVLERVIYRCDRDALVPGPLKRALIIIEDGKERLMWQ